MNSKFSKDVEKLKAELGYGHQQAINVVKYYNISEGIAKIGSGGEYDDPKYIQRILRNILLFCAPNECTGEDCSCHNQKEKDNETDNT